jgi:predicted alpha/beta hydrolase family esterase
VRCVVPSQIAISHSILMKAIIVPGNGCGDSPKALDRCMWYPWLAKKLREHGVEVVLSGFPDSLRARERIWKPFVLEQLGGLGPDCIVIGHSSGAACALRLMEEHSFHACILVSAYNSDLGDDLERGSGYFSRPFDWERMRTNVPRILQFHSVSDHLVPIAVGRDVAQMLQPTEYVETEDDGHFQDDSYDEVMWPAIAKLLQLE